MSKTTETFDELPVIWMLGKTGAGKSSVVQALTGESRAEVGNGFRPCTRTTDMFDFPQDAPVVRFLDTRGLGEAHYDPTEDLNALPRSSHVVLVVCRLDDPEQSSVVAALRDLANMPVVLVLTGRDLIDAGDAKRAAEHLRQKLSLDEETPVVALALPPEDLTNDPALDCLRDHLADVLPVAVAGLKREQQMQAERSAFRQARPKVLRYARVAGGSDLLPIVGLVSVPATQALMLRDLGRHYSVSWDMATGAGFGSALGLAVGARYGAGLALRQLGKLIPAYGQTLGTAAAGAISFASTFALGRSAGFYLHRRAADVPVDPDELRSLYQSALRRGSDGVV